MNEITSYTFITIDELAAALNISRNSAYTLLKKGEVKSFKIGNHYKIPLSSVDEYITRMTGLPIPDFYSQH